MTLSDYQTITGTTVATADQTRVTAQITRTQRILETLLGYSLDTPDTNEYTEIGKTATECPCPDVDMDALEDADAVVGAYRLFTYRKGEKIISIDPASEIHAVKLVKVEGDDTGITFKTLEDSEYRVHKQQGIMKYLEECEDCCFCACSYDCYCVQLAVDGTWVLPGDDLDQVWADMITFYSDPRHDIQSEKLGSHSYSKFYDSSKSQPMQLPRPELQPHNAAVIVKWAGHHGTARRILTV